MSAGQKFTCVILLFTGVKYRFITEKEYSVGRAGCDILVENDKSISRSHAILKAHRNDAHVVCPT